MDKFVDFSIDLNKIPEEFILTTDKNGEPFKSGGKFVNLRLFINEQPDNFGNDIKVVIKQPKDSESQTIYVGQGKQYKD